MSAEFIDSNVFIYLFDRSDDRKRKIAEELYVTGLQSRSAVISFQVVQEVLSVLTTKLRPAPPLEDVQDFLNKTLTPLWRILPSAELYRRALTVQARYGYGFYDSLTVAAALESGCAVLYSEDLRTGQRIHGLTIVNPFAAAS